MATLSGTWIFSNSPSIPSSTIRQVISGSWSGYTGNNEFYDGFIAGFIAVYKNHQNIVFMDSRPSDFDTEVYPNPGDSGLSYDITTQTWDNQMYLSGDTFPSGINITFGEAEQEVSDEFYVWFTANAKPVIKGKWRFNEVLVNNTSNNNRNDIRQAVNFESNGRSFESVVLEFGDYINGFASMSWRLTFGVGYNPMYMTDGGWTYTGLGGAIIDRTAYRDVDFGETEQLVSEEFYAWFTENAVQITTDLTDLTGTIWYVPKGWKAAERYGYFSLRGYVSTDVLSDTISYNFEFGIGFEGEISESSDQIYIIHAGGAVDDYSIETATSFILSITGGTDVTNPKLIAWLQTYGELQEPEEPEEPDTPVVDILPIYKRISGEWIKQNAYQMCDGVWVQISTKESD